MLDVSRLMSGMSEWKLAQHRGAAKCTRWTHCCMSPENKCGDIMGSLQQSGRNFTLKSKIPYIQLAICTCIRILHLHFHRSVDWAINFSRFAFTFAFALTFAPIGSLSDHFADFSFAFVSGHICKRYQGLFTCFSIFLWHLHLKITYRIGETLEWYRKSRFVPLNVVIHHGLITECMQWVQASLTEGRELESWLSQTNDLKINVCCYIDWHSALLG